MPRFSPTPLQVTLLEAVAGAASYSLALLLRFVDEPVVPANYATRLLPWAVLAAIIHVGVGRIIGWLRRARSPLRGRPVLPFVLGGVLALALVLAVNWLLQLVDLRMPLFVAVVGSLLATAASAALRIAGDRPEPTAAQLLPRRIVELDVEACAPALRDRRVLITGAAGSIGSELARQVLAVGPSKLVLLDTNESGLFDLEGELRGRGVSVHPVMGNVADIQRTSSIFARERPQVVFHAAAYKHVPLVEANPDQGFVTNVLGTLSVCQAAAAVGAERVVVISTDKAVNPSSFMGLTKRTAELIVSAIGSTTPGTTMTAVRFGNVLGSRGSVVPTLLRQIDAGGPVTITDRDAKRYFMTISEAASLVLRSAAFGAPGAVYVLDMGEELRIVDLAERLVRLKGLTPGRDVPFVYTGLRPGEKLCEELVGEDESLVATAHPYVRRVQAGYSVDGASMLDELRAIDEQRRQGTLSQDEYPPRLRAMIARALRRPESQLTPA